MKRALAILIAFLFFLPIYSFAQQKLQVDGDLKIQSDSSNRRFGLILRPRSTMLDSAGQEGQVYYNSDNKQLYYHDGTVFKPFGKEKRVGTIIVAAYNSKNSTVDGSLPSGSPCTNCCVGDGTSCLNRQADYTCDGTDDQEVIHNAITICPAGGVVYLLEGTYNLSDAITVGSDHGLGLYGTGPGTMLKVVAMHSAANAAIYVYQHDLGFYISQLRIDANHISNVNGITVSEMSYSVLEKVWVENALNGILVDSSAYTFINDCNIRNNSGYGISLYVDSNNNFISGNNIQSNAQGIGLTNSCDNNIITGNNIQANNSGSANGLYNDNGTYNAISNNNFQSNGKGITFGCGAMYNIISGNNFQSQVNSAIVFSCGNAGANNGFNVVKANMIQSNNASGTGSSPAIDINNFCSNNISGNLIFDNGGTSAQDSLEIRTRSSNNVVSSNRVYDSAGTGYGINIADNTCSANYLSGNLIDGAGLTGRLIQDLGVLTKYTDKAKITLEKQQVNIGTASYTLNMATSPRTFAYLNPSVNVTTLTLSNGKAAGDLLIIENGSLTNSVTLNESGNCNLGAANRALGQYDTIQLIWNGSQWLEIYYNNNT